LHQIFALGTKDWYVHLSEFPVLVCTENNGSPEEVIKRFEQRSHAVDSRGAAEYLRALILTNTIADYLPDEQSGRSASLPSLVRSFHNSLIIYITPLVPKYNSF
jgi:hypothetical protein